MLRRFAWVIVASLCLLPWMREEPAEAGGGRLCVERGICHKVVSCSATTNTVVIHPGTSSFTVPQGITQLTKVGAIAAGGGGANGGYNTAGGGGGYSENDNVAVTPGQVITVSVGSGGAGGASNASSGVAGSAGGDTWFNSTSILLAKGGGGGQGGDTNPGAGGQASAGVGTIKHSGGTGGNGASGGGGGGGAGGPNGDGVAGTAGSNSGPPYLGGAGGAGDNSSGGAGGAGSSAASSPGSPGGAGKEFAALYGSGGGGGGGSGGTGQESAPGASGAFGAGGGAPGYGAPDSFLAGANGGDGAIIVQYVGGACAPSQPAPPQNTFFVATNGNDSNPGTLAQPFLTLGQCQTAMRNSSTTKTCTIRSGSYSIASPITLGPAPTDNGETFQYYTADGVNTAVFDGGGTSDVFHCTGCQGVTINGLKMQNLGKFGIYQSGGSYTSGVIAKNNTYENNEITGNHQAAAGTYGACIGTDGAATNTQILNNYCHDVLTKGIAMISFQNTSDFICKTLIQGNVVLRAVSAENDDGAIYSEGIGNAINSAANCGSDQSNVIQFNYTRDHGQSGGFGQTDIYLDEGANNWLVQGNVAAPALSGSVGTGNDCAAAFHSDTGFNNTFKNNLVDMGFSTCAFPSVIFYDSGGQTTLTNNVFTNNIFIWNYAGSSTSNHSGVSGSFIPQNSPYVAADFTIGPNAYHNFGGGAEPTNGNVAGDGNPQHYTPAQLGLTCTNGMYSVAGGSTVTGAPVNFPALPTSFGPPGFTIPSSTNHSC